MSQSAPAILPQGRVLIIAGSDSSGGAGIQADIKTVTMLGGYAMTAITAITAQNTLGVQAVSSLSAALVDQQITACLDDIGADSIKTGMIGSVDMVMGVANRLARQASDLPLIVDPVMVASSGDRLVDEAALHAIRDALIPQAALVTPNLPEASLLTGLTIKTPEDQTEAGQILLEMGAGGALIKGGHLEGDLLTDVLVTPQGVSLYPSNRLKTTSTHGTGCTLASAIATGLAHGQTLEEATRSAHAYLYQAIASAPGFGQGHGPVRHNWSLPAHSVPAHQTDKTR